MAEQNVTTSDMEIAALIKAISEGVSIGDACGMTNETIEGLYAFAYNLYSSGNYEDAATVFQALCLYQHKDVRFWMGLGGCRQANGDLKGAVDAYSMAGTVALLSDPEPFFYAARCYVQLGDKENAIGALKGLLTIGEASDPAHAQCHSQARQLLELLDK